jgi:hypothetical protein
MIMAVEKSEQPTIDFAAFKRALLRFVTNRYADKPQDLIYKSDIEHLIDTVYFDKEYHFCLLKSDQTEFERGEALKLNIQHNRISDDSENEISDLQTQTTPGADFDDYGLIYELLDATSVVDLTHDGSVELCLGEFLDGRDLNDLIIVRDLLIEAATKKLDFLEKKRKHIDGIDVLMATGGAYPQQYDKNELKKLDKKIANLRAVLEWLRRTTRKRGVFKKKSANDFRKTKLIDVLISHSIRCTHKDSSEEFKYNLVNSKSALELFRNAVKEKLNSRFLPKDFYLIVNSYAKKTLGAQCTESQFQSGVEYCADRFNNTELANPICLREAETIYESDVAPGSTQNTPVYNYLIRIAADMKTSGLNSKYFKRWIFNAKYQKKIIQNIKYAAKEIGNDGTLISLADIVNAGTRYHITIDTSGLPKAPNSSNPQFVYGNSDRDT